MVKPLSFKGDKPKKKRKRTDDAPAASNPDEADNDDSWVTADVPSDVSGPILFVLPTDPPTSLACDTNGTVFTLPIENIVDALPTTAEPHDVRQVWVANKIAGTESWRFKGQHGRYLSCDKSGALTAGTEAVSPLEMFNLVATPDTPGTFQVQTLRETYLTTGTGTGAGKGKGVSGNAEDVGFNTTWRIRMQARFKPKLKANKEEKALAKISRRELEEAVGRRLDEDEVRTLKKARREGDYHEKMLGLRSKSKHDKYS